MKTSFSMKVTGSITVSIEPSNEDGGAAAADDCGSILVDVLLKSLVNDAVKKYVHQGTTIGDNDNDNDDDDDDDDDIFSPIPQRRVPADANDDEEEQDAEEQDSEADEEEDEVADLPNVEITTSTRKTTSSPRG
jgi:hypothetical protein